MASHNPKKTTYGQRVRGGFAIKAYSLNYKLLTSACYCRYGAATCIVCLQWDKTIRKIENRAEAWRGAA